MTNALALPDIATATLPATYERAKEALARCQRIDECKDWADRAAALASYAKQADDRGLMTMAVRIQSRAVRRCGELLKTFQNERARTDLDGGTPTQTQRRAAEAAGISKDQEVQAVRVANVPAAEFEAAVESDNPPTVTALAEAGRASNGAAVPAKFKAATHMLGILRELKLFATEHDDAALVADAIADHEAVSIREALAVAGPWLERLLVRLQEKYPC